MGLLGIRWCHQECGKSGGKGAGADGRGHDRVCTDQCIWLSADYHHWQRRKGYRDDPTDDRVKVAVSDHRSSNPSGDDLIALATAARRAGLLSGTPGLVTMHMGSGKGRLDPVFYVLDHSDVPAKNLLPTHMLRTPELMDAGVELVKRGGYIDCTAGSDDQEVENQAVKLFDLLHRDGMNMDHVTMSSDAFGSQPRFNAEGECVGLTYASPKYLHKTIQILVRMGMPFEQALKLLTTTPAVLLGKEGKKGCVAAGADADLLILDENLEITSLLAKGKVALWEKELRMKGRFEE